MDPCFVLFKLILNVQFEQSSFCVVVTTVNLCKSCSKLSLKQIRHLVIYYYYCYYNLSLFFFAFYTVYKARVHIFLQKSKCLIFFTTIKVIFLLYILHLKLEDTFLFSKNRDVSSSLLLLKSHLFALYTVYKARVQLSLQK